MQSTVDILQGIGIWCDRSIDGSIHLYLEDMTNDFSR